MMGAEKDFFELLCNDGADEASKKSSFPPRYIYMLVKVKMKSRDPLQLGNLVKGR